ncbi:MAG: hypothetical protein HY720_09630 [Planctomycetes bacterium]|nr:hypothetical protein [Planctomycetota bacterium]
MAFEFSCFSCGNPIRAQMDLVGRSVACPVCAVALVVPDRAPTGFPHPLGERRAAVVPRLPPVFTTEGNAPRFPDAECDHYSRERGFLAAGKFLVPILAYNTELRSAIDTASAHPVSDPKHLEALLGELGPLDDGDSLKEHLRSFSQVASAEWFDEENGALERLGPRLVHPHTLPRFVPMESDDIEQIRRTIEIVVQTPIARLELVEAAAEAAGGRVELYADSHERYEQAETAVSWGGFLGGVAFGTLGAMVGAGIAAWLVDDRAKKSGQEIVVQGLYQDVFPRWDAFVESCVAAARNLVEVHAGFRTSCRHVRAALLEEWSRSGTDASAFILEAVRSENAEFESMYDCRIPGFECTPRQMVEVVASVLE